MHPPVTDIGAVPPPVAPVAAAGVTTVEIVRVHPAPAPSAVQVLLLRVTTSVAVPLRAEWDAVWNRAVVGVLALATPGASSSSTSAAVTGIPIPLRTTYPTLLLAVSCRPERSIAIDVDSSICR